MKKKVTAVFVISAVCLMVGCGGKEVQEPDTPKELTETYLSYMKEGAYEEAANLTGTEFDKAAYENSADLQKNAMKAAYAEMKYQVQEENIEDGKAAVSVEVTNADYLSVMDNAIFETMEKQEDDAYTEELFKKGLKEAEPATVEVLVNYRKEEGKWVFDGSNSQLQAAMLGYLAVEE